MSAIASQITSLTIVYTTVYPDADQRKHHSSASLAFVRGIHRGPVNFPHKCPVTRKMFPFDDVIMVKEVPGLNQLNLSVECLLMACQRQEPSIRQAWYWAISIFVVRLTTFRRRQNDRRFQTIFAKTFSWLRMYEFRSRFHWSLFLRVQLTIFHHWLRQWLGAGQATSHCLNQWW